MADFDLLLDASGLNCPLPVLRVKRSLNGMAKGKVLKMIATDPGAARDVEALCRQTGDALLSSVEEGGKFLFLIQKSV